MKFIKDILLIETTTTGKNPEKDSILQLSAILLDKDNLLQKASFNSYVRVSLLEDTISQHARILQIEEKKLLGSPKIYDVVKKFNSQFGQNNTLATHNLNNLFFLKNAYKKASVGFDVDLHVIELWTLAYIYSLTYGIKKMPTLFTLLDHFRIKLKNNNDAFEKVKAEAAIFKKIVSHA